MDSIILYGITHQELSETIRQAVQDEIAKVLAKESHLTLYSRKETARQLRISLPTLSKYIKRGHIKGSKVGTRVLFSEEDIRAALSEIPAQTYLRK